MAQVLLPENHTVAEGMFTGRNYYNSLVNPENLPKVTFPAGYDVFRTFTRQILDKRAADKDKALKVATATGSGKIKKTRSQTKSKEAADDSDTESVTVLTAPEATSNDAASDQMLVDEDAPAKGSLASLKFKKTGKGKDTARTTTPVESTAPPTKPKKANTKRARTDSNPFNEEAFLTAAAADFYTNHASIPVLIDEIDSIARQDSDFLENQLAIRKRIYYINVELSCLLEQFRSGLHRRSQLIEEGQFLSETLQRLGNASSSGLDNMVP
ncbi:hypothetical protein C8R46DRAFT_1222555 [Mycena filopes]|nr:hypothetical protein C8R46DRAFT_1222555 [Mycena filopes]